MFFKKCEKKGHPIIAIMIGALAVVGAFAVKKSGMQFIREKWNQLTSALKNAMPTAGSADGES